MADVSMIVLLGHNRFVDCETLIAFQQRAVLRISSRPPRVFLEAPAAGTRTDPLRVDDRDPQLPLRVIASDVSFAVFNGEEALVLATQIDPDTVHVRIDLRSIGINLFDDVAGLHIGTNVLTGNMIERFPVAINLAD